MCYRPPDITVDFWDELNESVINLGNDNPQCNLVITGDLNAHIGTRNWQKLQSVWWGPQSWNAYR